MLCTANPILYVICYVFSITPAIILPIETNFVNSLTIKDMRNQDPFYFKQISTANTICNIYSVDLNLDIQNYFANNAVILTGIANLENACKIVEKDEICRNIIAPLRAQINLIYEQAHTIESFHSRIAKRETKNTNQKNSTTDLVSNLLTITSESIARTNDEIEHLTNEIKTLQNINYDIKLTDLHNRLNLMTQSVLINIDRQMKLSTTIFETITNINANKIFELLSPSTFFNIINTVQALANNEKCEIPIYPFKHHLSSVLKTAKIQTKLIWDTLNIKIDFPTAKKEEFLLHEIISLPFTSHNETYIIKPLFSHLLSRQKSNNEYEIQYMSDEDKRNCIDMPTNTYFCRPTQPIYTVKEIYLNGNDNNFMKHDIVPCDIKSINNTENPKCNIEKFTHQNTAVNIDYGKYYVHVVSPFVAELICSNNRTSIKFTYTQICHTPSDCDLRSNSIQIYTHRTKTVDISRIKMNKNMILNKIDTSLDMLNDTFVLPIRTKTNNNHEQQESINNFKEKISNLFNSNQREHSSTSVKAQILIYIVLVLTPLTICLILCYYIYKLKQSIKDIKESSIYNHIVKTIEPDENSGYEKPFNLVFHYDVPKSIIAPRTTFETFYEERKKRFPNICLEPAPLLPERKYKNAKQSASLNDVSKIENFKNEIKTETPEKIIGTIETSSQEKNTVLLVNPPKEEEDLYVCMTFNNNKKHVTWDLKESNT